jgi:glutamine synthetase
MPKPIFGINGSGMHCHQSLADNKTGKNLFFSKSDPYNLSTLAKSFVAGQLKYIKEISAITSPIVNSYKRLIPGYEAPVYICWAKTNRSALIRIPNIKKQNESGARAEIRCPDPTCNPYLALAVMLKAGLLGIEDKLPAPEPVEEDVYDFNEEQLKKHYIDVLPGSLGEAIGIMKCSELAESVLGSATFNKYIQIKTNEWDEYRIQVHQWEVKKYLMMH